MSRSDRRQTRILTLIEVRLNITFVNQVFKSDMKKLYAVLIGMIVFGAQIEAQNTDHRSGCPDLEIVEAISQLTCSDSCDASITVLDVANAIPPFRYLWNTGDTTASISGLCSGFYSVTITDDDDCEVFEFYELPTPTPLTLTIEGTNETVEGQNDGTAIVMVFGGNQPYVYQWSNGLTDAFISNLAPGTYYVTVSDVNMCMATDSVVIAPGMSTGLSEILAQQIKISPNPVNDIVFIQHALNADVEVSLLSLEGQYLKKIFNATQLNVSDVSEGMYMLKVQNKDEYFFKKIIIIR